LTIASLVDPNDGVQAELAVNMWRRPIAHVLDDDRQSMRIEFQNHQVGPRQIGISLQHGGKLVSEPAVNESLLLIPEVAARPAVTTSGLSFLPPSPFYDVIDGFVDQL
jgi:hypothetical protein